MHVFTTEKTPRLVQLAPPFSLWRPTWIAPTTAGPPAARAGTSRSFRRSFWSGGEHAEGVGR